MIVRGSRSTRLRWVEDKRRRAQVLLDGDWFLLRILAAAASDDGLVSFKIEDLADRVAWSVRTAQYALRRLEVAGLIEATGRTQRLERSTRTVPLYQLGSSGRRRGPRR